MTLPDILGEAKGALARASGAKVTVLSPGRGDFRLDGIDPSAALWDFGKNLQLDLKINQILANLLLVEFFSNLQSWSWLCLEDIQ